MAARRDRRRFGPGPFLLGLQRDRARQIDDYRAGLAVLEAIERLRFDRPVTLLSGDNGSGKSTVVELAAEAIGFDAQGGELERKGELPATPRAVVNRAIEPLLSSTKPRNGYFLRAESFFNIAAFTDSDHRFAPDLSLYGDVALHQQSHGESLLALAANRFGAEGPLHPRRTRGGPVGHRTARETLYDDLDAVRLMRGFLDAPERYLRAALDDER